MNALQTFIRCASLYVLVLPLTSPVYAAERQPDRISTSSSTASHLPSLTDQALEERLAYAERALDAHRTHAAVWWYGWSGFYAVAIVTEGTLATLTDDSAERADLIVAAAKTSLGLAALLIQPLQAKDGADDVRSMPGATRLDRVRRLEHAEAQLRINAKAADDRYFWLRHLATASINIAGGLIVAEGYDDPARGWRSAAIGFAVGEAMIWSQPWQPRQDLDAYEDRYRKSATSSVRWNMAPTLGGASIRGHF